MKAVFFGTPASAVPALQAMARAGHEISLVVTQPDRRRGRSAELQPPPVKRAARELGLPVVQPQRLRHELVEPLRKLAPDILVVVAYGRILPAEVLVAARVAPINVHFSLLPRYRGAAPVQWALANGERVTGVTTMWMSERLDEGDILLQEPVEIRDGEHAPALAVRLAEAGAALLLRTLEELSRGRVERRPQDPAHASYAPALRREDGRSDFTLPARLLEGRIRGFDPWPGVWAQGERGRCRLVEGRATDDREPGAEPGTVLALDGEAVLVACGDGSVLRLARVQPESRRVMSARDAVNGRLLRVGEKLGPG